ncbi:MAG: hypothetical protein IKN03_01155 [Fibrobacter sp.]|nr:hypothetical protein [Fibrobacter sp.]
MPTKKKVVNTLYDLASEYPGRGIQGKYKSLDYHRDRNPAKAQWIISVNEEIDSFADTKANNWIDGNKGWGIIIGGKSHKIIGYVRNKGENIFVYIACFVNGAKTDEWHGYPANIARGASDRPVDSVLGEWRESKYISNSEYSRIRRGIL